MIPHLSGNLVISFTNMHVFLKVTFGLPPFLIFPKLFYFFHEKKKNKQEKSGGRYFKSHSLKYSTNRSSYLTCPILSSMIYFYEHLSLFVTLLRCTVLKMITHRNFGAVTRGQLGSCYNGTLSPPPSPTNTTDYPPPP